MIELILNLINYYLSISVIHLLILTIFNIFIRNKYIDYVIEHFLEPTSLKGLLYLLCGVLMHLKWYPEYKAKMLLEKLQE